MTPGAPPRWLNTLACDIVTRSSADLILPGGRAFSCLGLVETRNPKSSPILRGDVPEMEAERIPATLRQRQDLP
jgi:hypothetical protein